MKMKTVLKTQVKACPSLKAFIYLIGKYNFDIAQQNLAIADNGFIVTADPKFGFFYNSTGKRKDAEVDNQKLKIQKNDSPVIPCDLCGRSTVVRVDGKSIPHTSKTCF